MVTIAFFGHRHLYQRDIREKLKNEIKKHLSEELHVIIGTHGDFDRLALSVCREIRRDYPNLKITIVFTTLTVLKKQKDESISIAELYNDVETLIYNIEEVYFKNRIIVSNRKMVEECDFVICYVDMKKNYSGAKKTINYAIKINKPVVNLFSENDKMFVSLTKDEVDRI